MKPEIYNAYVKILHEELVPAMGCTEPIAIAYASALARDTLGTMPERMEVQASGNLIKNVKSVVVPNTNGLKGIEAAVAAGVVAGDAGKALEVISVVSGEQKARIQDMVGRGMCKVSLLDSGLVLDLIVTLHAGDDWARVRIVNHHTDVVLIEKTVPCCWKSRWTPPAPSARSPPRSGCSPSGTSWSLPGPWTWTTCGTCSSAR